MVAPGGWKRLAATVLVVAEEAVADPTIEALEEVEKLAAQFEVDAVTASSSRTWTGTQLGRN